MKIIKLFLYLILSIPFMILLMGLLLLLPAGNLYWLNGWIFIASMIFYLLLTFVYFIIKDPSTLEKRSKLNTMKADIIFFLLVSIVFLLLILIPAFDYRFGWSQIPFFISWIGITGLIVSYLILFLVMRENSFASKGLMIHDNQAVIDTGPYSRVRHPMYVAFIIMSFSIPLTLGSLIGIIPAISVPFITAFRIHKEEEMLLTELEDYNTYLKKVKYRLIPKIW